MKLLKQRAVIIPYVHLHPEIRAGIDELSRLRGERAKNTKRTAIVVGALVAPLGAVEKIPAAQRAHNMMALGVISGSAMIMMSIAQDNAVIKKKIQAIADKGFKQGFVADEYEGKYPILPFLRRNTILFVRRDRSIVLAPSSRVEEALKKARETFYGDLLPASFRGYK